MSATGRIRVLSEPLQPPPGCSYPEGTTLRAVTRTKRRKHDFYETPAYAIEPILPWLPCLQTAKLVVDAGSGNGAIAAAIASKYPQLEIIGVEKQEELVQAARARGLYAAEFVCEDFEKWDADRQPDLVIMNPPYSRALEFVKRALQIVKRGGTVAAILSLGWAAGRKRHEFRIKHPCDLHVLSSRPSFTGQGTDACDYAWFVWGPGAEGRWYSLPPRAIKKKRKRNADNAATKRKAKEPRATEAAGTGLVP